MLIYPFRGILYNKKKIKDLKNVFAPPYDVISRARQDGYYKASPFNAVRLILNKPSENDTPKNNVYTRAAGFFKQWLKEGILKQDKRPSIYIYGQEFKCDGRLRRTLGFIGISYLGGAPAGLAMPHENTFDRPRQDRERLLEAAGANLSCVYTLFEDSLFGVAGLLRQAVSAGRPHIDVTIDKVRHTLWKVADKAVIKRLKALMKDKNVFIADGHHRYEAALNYRDKIAAADKNFNASHPANYIMTYFTGMEDENLTILATHRVVKDLPAPIINGLSGHFYAAPMADKNKMFRAMNKYFGKGHIFGMYSGGKFSVLKLRNEDAGARRGAPLHDVSILHNLVLKGAHDIFYTRNADEAVMMVDKKGYKAAFFLNPTLACHIKTTGLAGERMPHKSTYFYPKLLSGLVMRRLDDV